MAKIKASGIKEDTIIWCPLCEEKATAREWDEYSFNECKNRRMRRDFTHIYSNNALDRNGQNNYKCKGCGKWVHGFLLRVDREIQ